jgi:hypothetical protein
MRVLHPPFGKTARRLGALALVLWLGGAGCLVGCEMDVSAATSPRAQAPGGEISCAAFAGPDCCRRLEDAGGHASIQTTEQAVNVATCCPVSGPAAITSGTAHAGSSALLTTPGGVTPAPPVENQAARTARCLRVRDRGGTHLLCCVFLI